MRLNGYSLARYEPDDELDGIWTRERLLEMDTLFIARVESAFACGLESRASAAVQVNLPASRAPRFVAPPPPDRLLRSVSEVVFVARG